MENEFKPLVLIPTYNEALNIKSFIEEVFKYCPDINLLIIDDNSPDNTAKLLIKVYSDNRVYLGFDHSTVMLKKIPNVDPLLNMASNEYGQYLATGIMVDSARITIQAARESGKEWYEIPYDYDDEDGMVNLNNMDPYTGI